MIGGAKIKIDTNSFQNDMTSMSNKDDVLTLLVHLGYLGFDFDTSSVYIPNNEIQHEFIRAVKNGKRSELVNLINESDELLQATINKDCTSVARIIEKVHDISTTPLYYNNEQALRSVIRFAYISCIDNYTEIQELPSGKGYADIVYIPRKNSQYPAMIVELKWNKSAQGAIDQIKEKNYPSKLQEYKDNLLLVGINYDDITKKHECIIEKGIA
jgi:hypothetical protein